MFDCIVNADAPYPHFLSVQGLELIQKVSPKVQGLARQLLVTCVLPDPTLGPYGVAEVGTCGAAGTRSGVPSSHLPRFLPAPPEVPREASRGRRAGRRGDQGAAILQGKWPGPSSPHCLVRWEGWVTPGSAVPTFSDSSSILVSRPPTGRPCLPALSGPPLCLRSVAPQIFATSRGSSPACRQP